MLVIIFYKPVFLEFLIVLVDDILIVQNRQSRFYVFSFDDFMLIVV